jgi:uroporphyrinogen-III synthase
VGKKSASAAKEAGFGPSTIPALLVEGDNRAGVGYATAQAIADAGISMDFLVAQVIGRKYSAVFGFESDADAAKCAAIIRKAVAAKKRKGG